MSSARRSSSAKTIAARAGRSSRPSAPDDAVAELRDHGVEAGRAGLDDLAGDGVGVDDHRAALGQQRSRGVLARAHSPGQSHSHGADASRKRRRARGEPRALRDVRSAQRPASFSRSAASASSEASEPPDSASAASPPEASEL